MQDVFLNHIRKNKVPVTIFLINGVKLQGVVSSFDNFSLLLRRDGHVQLVYKHAVSTVMPATVVRLYEPSSRRGGAAAGVSGPLTRTGAPTAAAGTRTLVLRPRWPAGERARPAVRRPARRGGRAWPRRSTSRWSTPRCVPLRQPRPATLFGSGRVATLGERIAAEEIALVVVDAPLSPVQQRNLERAWKCKVIDRTGLILEIFGARAKTREGRLQVELAALTYQRSRLVRSWTHLERQRGGFGFLGGPGEAQIELDRRRIDERIIRIERELEAVKRTRGLHREARERVAYPGDRPGRLHQRRQVDPVQPPDRGHGRRPRPAVRDPRPDHAPRSLCRPAAGDPVRHGGLHRRPADRSGGGVPRHPGGGRRPPALVIHVRDMAHAESAAQRSDVLEVLASLDLEHRHDEGRLVEFWNKLDLLDDEAASQARAAAARRPG